MILFIFILFSHSCLSIPPAPILSHVALDCRRIHPAFCCANRVRQNCAQLCLGPSSFSSPCVPSPFSSIQAPPPSFPSSQFQTSFGGSIDQSSIKLPSPNVDGPLPNLPSLILPSPPPTDQNVGRRRFTTEGEWTGHSFQVKNPPPPPSPHPHQPFSPPFFPPSAPPFGLILPPPDIPMANGTPVPIEDLDSIQQPEGQNNGGFSQTQVEAASSSEPELFPTLMPFPDYERSIDEMPKAESELKRIEEKVIIKEGGAIDGTASSRQNAKRKENIDGGGRALKPPHLMEELAELEGSLERADKNEWLEPIQLNLKEERNDGANLVEKMANNNQQQERTTVREGSLIEEERKPRIFNNIGGFAPIPSNQLWSFRIKPSGQRNGQQSRLDLPLPMMGKGGNKEKSDGTNQTAEGGIFGENINVFVDKLFNKQFLHSIATITNRNYSSINGSEMPMPTSTFPQPQSSSSSIPLQCGIPPHYVPCLPLDQANIRLQTCCQKRQMPAGCLPLCRYDTSQTEVKLAFDKGQCGILNVTPFLECASQGQNNLECCRHRQIAKLSGTQCEVFCTGEKIGLLGLQHLVCSTQIQSILQCHHSGLKP